MDRASALQSDSDLIAAYVKYAEALSHSVPEDTPEMDAAARSYAEVERVISDGSAPRAWELVRAVLRRAPDQRLDVYAAGPLEELVRMRGAEVVDALEAEAKADERFRWALGCIWLSTEDLPHDVLVRIVNASEGKIKPLGWASPGESSQAAI
jgi:hypothetical protein